MADRQRWRPMIPESTLARSQRISRTCVLKISLDGSKRLWSATCPDAWDSAVSLASSGGRLYLLSQKGKIYRYDAASGQKLDAWDAKHGDQLPTDLDAAGEAIVLAYEKASLVRWLSTAKGLLIAEARIDAPAGVAIGRNRATLVTTGQRVMIFAKPGAKPTELARGLTRPGPLAVDRASGNVLVVDREPARQIVRLAADGRVISTYGRAGGRRDGLYTREEQESFAEITDISALPDGGFVIAEPNSAPRRVVQLDRQGRFVKEWTGGQAWAPWVTPEPDNPDAVWMNSQWGSMMRMVVDWKTRTWRVHSTYHFAGLADGLVPGHANAAIWEAREHGGQLYLCRVGDPCVLRVDRENWRLVPMTVTYSHFGHYRKELPASVAMLGRANTQALRWTDANGDGKPQDVEILRYLQGGAWGGLRHVNSELSYWYFDSDRIWQQRVTEWTKSGSPVYGNFPAATEFARTPARVTSIEGRWGSYFYRDAGTRQLYGAFNSSMTDWGKSKDSFLCQWDEQGRLRWMAGEKGPLPGQINVFRRIAGVVHGCVVLTNFSYEWPSEQRTRTYVWDSDGLWVGRLFDHPDLDVAPATRYGLGAEALAGVITTDPRTGQVRYFGHWLNEARVYEIDGWNDIVRSSGTLSLAAPAEPSRSQSADDYAETPPGSGAGLSAEYFDNDGFKGPPLLARVDAVLDFHWGRATGRDTSPLAKHGGKSTGYSIRWTGMIEPRQTGLYSFVAVHGHQRVWIDGHKVAGDRVHEGPGGLIYLEAGRRYPIRVEYSTYFTHPTTDQGVNLQWVEPAGSYPASATLVPTSQLYPGNR